MIKINIEQTSTGIKKLFCCFFICFFLPAYSQIFPGSNFQLNENIKLQQYIGHSFPEFTVSNTNGDTISSRMLKGKITVVNFWYESCAPCMAELEALNQFVLKFKDNPDFQFLSFTIDSRETAIQAIRKLELPYDVYPITTEDSKRFFCTTFPTNLIIDSQGKIALIRTGVNKHNEQINLMELMTAYLLTDCNINSDFKNPVSYAVSASILDNSLNMNSLVEKILREHEEKRISALGSEYFEFNATTLPGKSISQDNLSGKITVINFWAESCSPCIEAFDFINHLYLLYKDNPAFQLFSFTSDSEEKAKKVVEKYNLLFDVACIDSDEIYRLNYQIGFPALLIIKSDKIVSHFITGSLNDKKKNEIEIVVTNLLN